MLITPLHYSNFFLGNRFTRENFSTRKLSAGQTGRLGPLIYTSRFDFFNHGTMFFILDMSPCTLRIVHDSLTRLIMTWLLCNEYVWTPWVKETPTMKLQGIMLVCTKSKSWLSQLVYLISMRYLYGMLLFCRNNLGKFSNHETCLFEYYQ